MLMVDEIWGFIGAKRKNAAAAAAYGDVWTFIALDADTKLIPSFIVGKRDACHAKIFIADLASRLQKRVQVSSDSLAAYAGCMERGFGTEMDYGQISKTFAFENLLPNAAGRYSPAEIVRVETDDGFNADLPQTDSTAGRSHVQSAGLHPPALAEPWRSRMFSTEQRRVKRIPYR